MARLTPKREIRLNKLAEMLAYRHMTQNQMAAELGVTRDAIKVDVAYLRAQWRAERSDLIAIGFDQDLRTIELLIAEAMRQALDRTHRHQLFAMDRVIALISRRAAMMGYDAPSKSLNLDLDPSKLTDEELTRIANGEDPLEVLRSTIAARNAGAD